MNIARIIIYLSVALSCVAGSVQSLSAADIFAEITSKYSIEIRIKPGRDFFPPDWVAPPISARATEIDAENLGRFPGILETALSPYPGELIRRNLKGIYLTGEIYFYNVAYGATSSTDVIYLNDRGAESGYTDEYLVGSFHHELAHILLRNYEFDMNGWTSLNPKGFSYYGGEDGGVQAIRQGRTSLAGTRKLYTSGFMTEYSLSSAEEDFCMYSEKILANPGEFAVLMEKYPRIKRKFELWLGFYRAIDGRITRAYIFDKQSPGDIRQRR